MILEIIVSVLTSPLVCVATLAVIWTVEDAIRDLVARAIQFV